ncbi:MAG: ATP-binding protein [Saprospiraceae bacterium]
MWHKITNLGIKSEQSLSEKKRIKLLNRVVLLFSAFVSIKFFQEIIVLDFTGLLITLVIMTLFLTTLGFHYYNKIVWARAYFTTMLIVATNMTNTVFGHGFGSEFGLFPIIIAIIIFFETQKVRLLWIMSFFVCYLLSSLYLQNNEPILLENLSQSTYYFMFVSCSGAVFLATSFFMNENKNYDTQMVELLEQLQIQNEGLAVANKELERFAFVASHDLKTPLRNINSFLNLIQRKMNKGQIEEIPEYLEFATLNAKRMYNLIEDILEFSRFTNSEISFQNEDMNEIISIAMSNMEDSIKSKNAVIHCVELPNIISNKTQMISLFQNLITNGIKYNESEIPTINISYEDYDRKYKIFVEDNGIGIDEEYQERIFEMFYRLHNQGEYEGSGIGLSSCRKIVMYHGGEISLTSEIGKGTKFCITLPKIAGKE